MDMDWEESVCNWKRKSVPTHHIDKQNPATGR